MNVTQCLMRPKYMYMFHIQNFPKMCVVGSTMYNTMRTWAICPNE